MPDIPITFTHQGKTYSARFTKVTGAGSSSIWHLYSDENFYLGALTINESKDFFFADSHKENELRYKARDFGNYIYEKDSF